MYKLWFTLIIISILKIDLPFADICIDFNEGDVTIQAAAITEKNIFFILKNRLFIFSFKSYDPGRMNIQLNKRYILNYGIEKLPNVTINDHINSMFVKQRLDDKKQFICYTILSNNESVYCQSQDENEQLMFSKSNGLLQGNQKLVLKMGEQREAIKLDITNGTLASGMFNFTKKSITFEYIRRRDIILFPVSYEKSLYFTLLDEKYINLNFKSTNDLKFNYNQLTRFNLHDPFFTVLYINKVWIMFYRQGVYIMNYPYNFTKPIQSFEDRYVCRAYFFHCNQTEQNEIINEKKIIFVLVMVMLIIVANLFTLILGLFLRDKDDQKPIPGASQPTSSSPLTMTSPKSNSKTLKNAIKSGSSNR